MGYQDVVALAEHKQALTRTDRFAKISERTDRCDISPDAWKSLVKNAHLQSWKGVLLNKGVIEIALYPMLLHELQPKTVIEIGALNGGSATWLADNLTLLDIQSQVYSVDIDLSLLDEKAKTHPGVTFIQGDCNHMETIFSPEMLSKLPHPWLIVEDAHANVLAVVDYFHRHGLQAGDYIIVEDTSVLLWETWTDWWDDQDEVETGKQKMSLLRTWLQDHEDEYVVDTHYQDMFGYNGSKNWNSILKRVSSEQ